MKSGLKAFLVLLVLLTVAGGRASATTIDFEGIAASGFPTESNVTPYTEDGFILTSSGSTSVYHNDIFNNVFGSNGNGDTTSIFGWCGECEGAPFVFTLTGPAPFTLSSIAFGGLATLYDPGQISLTGTFVGGGTITQVLDPTAAFSTFLFPGFTNLTQVQFGLNAIGNNPALDDIVVTSTVAAVPEPASLLLLGTGLIGAGVRRYRRRA